MISDNLAEQSHEQSTATENSTASEEVQQLANTLLDLGQKLVESENMFPLGASLSHAGKTTLEVVEPIGSSQALCDQLLKTLSEMAKAGQIKAAGICTSNLLPDLGKFLAASVQHQDGTNFAFIRRYWQNETLKFDDNLLIQKGAYTFFDEPVRHQLIGLWQLTGMNSPETGQRIPWKDAIAPTIELIIYQDDGTFQFVKHFDGIDTVFDSATQQFSCSNEHAVIEHCQGRWILEKNDLTEHSENDGKPKRVRILSVNETELLIEEPPKRGIALQMIYTRRSDLIK
jgi:hypothetical protein